MNRISSNSTSDIVVKVSFFILLAFQGVLAQNAATQTVMLQVRELNKIDLVGGALTLQIKNVGQDANSLDPAVDASTKLLWTTNGDSRKIDVASDATSGKFVLRIQAQQISPGAGTAEPEVTLSDNAPHDLILGVQRTAGSCTVRFTARSSAEQGTGSESHLITYTITGC